MLREAYFYAGSSRRCRPVRVPDFTTLWDKTMRVTLMMSSAHL